MAASKKAPAAKKKAGKAKAPKKAAKAPQSEHKPSGGREASLRNLKPFEAGKSGNPNGRPKKIYTVLKKTGFGKDDILTAFRELAFYTGDELAALVKKEDTPIILKTIAVTLREATLKGDLGRIRDILEYSLGRPRQRLELTGDEGGPIQIDADPEIDYSRLSDAALREISAARKRPSNG